MAYRYNEHNLFNKIVGIRTKFYRYNTIAVGFRYKSNEISRYFL